MFHFSVLIPSNHYLQVIYVYMYCQNILSLVLVFDRGHFVLFVSILDLYLELKIIYLSHLVDGCMDLCKYSYSTFV